jgi:hypothetical protein
MMIVTGRLVFVGKKYNMFSAVRHDPTLPFGAGCAPLMPDLMLLPRNQPR